MPKGEIHSVGHLKYSFIGKRPLEKRPFIVFLFRIDRIKIRIFFSLYIEMRVYLLEMVGARTSYLKKKRPGFLASVQPWFSVFHSVQKKMILGNLYPSRKEFLLCRMTPRDEDEKWSLKTFLEGRTCSKKMVVCPIHVGLGIETMQGKKNGLLYASRTGTVAHLSFLKSE